MESLKINLVKKPEKVVAFLREFNFGNLGESVDVAVDNCVEKLEKRHLTKERLLPGEPLTIDLLVDELEKAGFAQPGAISHQEWTEEAKEALYAARDSFKSLPKESQEELSKKHEDWRF